MNYLTHQLCLTKVNLPVLLHEVLVGCLQGDGGGGGETGLWESWGVTVCRTALVSTLKSPGGGTLTFKGPPPLQKKHWFVYFQSILHAITAKSSRPPNNQQRLNEFGVGHYSAPPPSTKGFQYTKVQGFKGICLVGMQFGEIYRIAKFN